VDRISSVKKDVLMSKQPFVTGEVSPFKGLLLAAILMILGLTLSWIINLQIFLLSLALLALGIIYSLPPRLKDVPFGDVITNSVSAGFICYAAGWCTSRNFAQISFLPVFWFTSLIASTYLLTVIIDVEYDKKAGLNTTAKVLGVKKTVTLSFTVYVVSLALYTLLLINKPKIHYIILIPFLLTSPYSYYKVYKQPTSENVYKLGESAVKKCLILVLILALLGTFLSDLI
jgi:4-hydroxybenzoate polyprenyltransferase